MAAITKTVVKFANVSELVTMSGDRDPAAIKEQFKPFYPFLANATHTVSVSGDTKTITFSEQQGTKGC